MNRFRANPSISNTNRPRAGKRSRSRLPSAITYPYNYGYPFFGASEPNVLAQWVFDETSGNIVDEVGGLTLTAGGTPVYSVAGTANAVGVSPGITIDLASNARFRKAADTTLAPGTADFTIEWWETSISASGGTFPVLLDTRDGSGHGIYIYKYNGKTKLDCALKADDDTIVTATFTTSVAENTQQKYRLVATRASNLELFIDGISQGAVDISSLSGKTISATACVIGNDITVGNSYQTTLYEFRFSKNATNNSGGPGGG